MSVHMETHQPDAGYRTRMPCPDAACMEIGLNAQRIALRMKATGAEGGGGGFFAHTQCVELISRKLFFTCTKLKRWPHNYFTQYIRLCLQSTVITSYKAHKVLFQRNFQ